MREGAERVEADRGRGHGDAAPVVDVLEMMGPAFARILERATGIVLEGWALGPVLSAILGVLIFVLLWCIRELKEEARRMERGWSPRKPGAVTCPRLGGGSVTS